MDISRLEGKLDAIGKRLDRLENEVLGRQVKDESPAPPATQNVSLNYSEEIVVSAGVDSAAQYRQAVRSSKTVRIPRSGNWLGIVAIICFVLAAAFIIKLSIESGWLTPARQIAIAALFGFTLVGAGFKLLKSDRGYASYLPGAGIIVLYLTVFSAHRLYQLFPFEVALAATSIVSGVCIWLYTKIRHDIYPITAAAGAYLAPTILGFQAGYDFTIYYFIVCSFAFATISVWVRSRLLTMIAAYAAIFLTAVVGIGVGNDVMVSIAMAAHFVVFAFGSYLHSKSVGRPLSVGEAWSFMPVLVTFYGLEYFYIDRFSPELAPWISLVFAAVLVGIYLMSKATFKDKVIGSEPVILTFASLVFFHSVYLNLLPADAKPWLFVAIALGVTFVLPRFETKKGSSFFFPFLFLMGIMALEFLNILFHVLKGDDGMWLVLAFASVASLWAMRVVAVPKFKNQNEIGLLVLSTAHLLAILAFYRLTTDIGSLAVSGAWLVYAVAVLVFGFVRQDATIAKSATFVLVFAAGKALLYDVSAAPTTVRILCLLFTGGVLYGTGFLMRKIDTWKEPEHLDEAA